MDQFPEILCNVVALAFCFSQKFSDLSWSISSANVWGPCCIQPSLEFSLQGLKELWV